MLPQEGVTSPINSPRVTTISHEALGRDTRPAARDADGQLTPSDEAHKSQSEIDVYPDGESGIR